MKAYRFLEIGTWGMIQKRTKNGWFRKLLSKCEYRWVDFGSSNKIEDIKKLYNKFYKDLRYE